jgi:class 3 adenylate cyclase
MGTLELKYHDVEYEEGIASALSISEFNRFNESILGLGDISKEAETVEAIAAIFDLEGFTAFANQHDPHLEMPEYLHAFLHWLFDKVVKEFTIKGLKDDMLMWSALPFFAKFMGDGVLFLWNSKYCADKSEMGNIIVNLSKITRLYEKDFLPKIKTDISHPPKRLRCGVARGRVISVGDKTDWVGPCINLSSRLQKLGSLPFSFQRKGFEPSKCFSKEVIEILLPKKVKIRGIDNDEIIMIFKSDFEKLSKEEQAIFIDP